MTQSTQDNKIRICTEEGCNESLEGRHVRATQCLTKACQRKRDGIRNAENLAKAKAKKKELLDRHGVF